MRRDPSHAAPGGRSAAPLAEFLRRLRAQGVAGKTALPTVHDISGSARQIGHSAERVDRFVQAANAAGCQAVRVALRDWPFAVSQALARNSVRSVVVDGARGFAERMPALAELEKSLFEDGLAIHRGADDELLFAVDAAITGVDAAIAETGSLVWASATDRARGHSLIPPVHVATVFADQILPDLCDFFADLDPNDLPANINLITGPSKTADIEGVLVTGVHGPGHVHVLVIDGA